MRGYLLLSFSLLTAPVALGQCSQDALKQASERIGAAHRAALAYKSGPMDSGVPADAIPLLLALKDRLVEGSDAVLGCQNATADAAQTRIALNEYLRRSASDVPVAENSDGLSPVVGVFGNGVVAEVHDLPGARQLRLVSLSSSVPCGEDAQVLVYEYAGRWKRVLRWSSRFPIDKDRKVSSEIFGDFVLDAYLADGGGEDGWRLVVAHGTPWCTSRFSGFGIAVLAPAPDGDGKMVWQTSRSFSRGDYRSRLRAVDGHTFEFRTNVDEMQFDENGFERTAVYRYRVAGDRVTRVEPIATNGRGFVEEWLTMPWEEAAAQSAPEALAVLRPLHQLHEVNDSGDMKNYVSWAAGPVRACTDAGRFQVAFDSQRENLDSKKIGGDDGPVMHHFFFIREVKDGYRMEGVASAPDASCKGPDLMRSAK